VLQNLGTTFERAYFADVSIFREDEKARLVSGDFKARLVGHDPFRIFARHFERVRGLDPLSQLLYVDLKTWLASDMLVKVDRMSMANGLEIRCPLLDHRIIEFAATIPSDLKYRGRTSKYLLKRHLEGRVPASVIHRPKQGFEIPLGRWLRRDLHDLASDVLFSPRALGRGHLEPRRLRRIWERHQRGSRDHSAQIWAVLMFEMWARTFLDPPAPSGSVQP
jgi:asparagine synthase (glutamine-hydrolysing)